MRSTIRIPMVTGSVSFLLYGLLSLALPAGLFSAELVKGLLVLLSGALLLHVMLCQDARDRDEAELSLRQAATHDSLTGLLNRAHFQEILDRTLARAERLNQSFGVAYIDLDGFKRVNDQYGHHVGDLLLTEVAARIMGVVRAGDCAARFGGDEFVILVDDRKEYGAYRLAERLRVAFAKPFLFDDLTLEISASIGVACYPDHGRHGLNLLQAADKAMYCAKTRQKSVVA